MTLIWRTLRRNRLALVGLTAVMLVCLLAVLGPQIAPYDPAEQSVRKSVRPPSPENWLGTDQWGRDIFSRIIVGSRVSLSVGAVSVVILVTIGVTIGALAGYKRQFDGPLMRFVDIMMSIPGFFLLLTIVALLGSRLLNTMLVIGLTSWMSTARLVRGQFLSLREKEFVQAARCLGTPGWRTITHHLLPNTLPVIIVQATLSMSQAILIESSLSHLGMGTQPTTPSWGACSARGATICDRRRGPLSFLDWLSSSLSWLSTSWETGCAMRWIPACAVVRDCMFYQAVKRLA